MVKNPRQRHEEKLRCVALGRIVLGYRWLGRVRRPGVVAFLVEPEERPAVQVNRGACSPMLEDDGLECVLALLRGAVIIEQSVAVRGTPQRVHGRIGYFHVPFECSTPESGMVHHPKWMLPGQGVPQCPAFRRRINGAAYRKRSKSTSGDEGIDDFQHNLAPSPRGNGTLHGRSTTVHSPPGSRMRRCVFGRSITPLSTLRSIRTPSS